MALSAAGATFNAAMLVAIAAWEAYTDSLAQGAEIQIVKMKPRLDSDHTATTGDAHWGIDANLGAGVAAEDYDFGKKFKTYNKDDVADSFAVSVGNSGPLFFMVTNDANELA